MINFELKKNIYYSGVVVIGMIFYFLKLKDADILTLVWYQSILFFSYIAALIDIRYKKVPNELILLMILSWFIIMGFNFYVDANIAIEILKESIIGFFVGGFLFLLVYIISKKGLGGGDVKFIAACGLFLQTSGVLSVVFIGSIIAALSGMILVTFKKITPKDTIPLIPFLYIGILMSIFYM